MTRLAKKELSYIQLLKFVSFQNYELDVEEDIVENSDQQLQQILESENLSNELRTYFRDDEDRRQLLARRLYDATVDNDILRPYHNRVRSFVTDVWNVPQQTAPSFRVSQTGNGLNVDVQTDANNNNNIFNVDSLLSRWDRERAQRNVFQQIYDGRIPPNLGEARVWYGQILDDLSALQILSACATERNTLYDKVCFHAYQLVEMALKAAVMCTRHTTYELRGHNLAALRQTCAPVISTNNAVVNAVSLLANYYIPTRYPINNSVTAARFGSQQATEAARYAIEATQHILAYVASCLTS